MPSPRARDKAAQKLTRRAALAGKHPERAEVNRHNQALAVACEVVGIPYRALPAPSCLQDVHFLSALPSAATYAERQRRDRMPHSWEMLLETVRG